MNTGVNRIEDLSTLTTKVNCSGVYVLIINNHHTVVRLYDSFTVILRRGTNTLQNQFVQRIFPSHGQQRCGAILLCRAKTSAADTKNHLN